MFVLDVCREYKKYSEESRRLEYNSKQYNLSVLCKSLITRCSNIELSFMVICFLRRVKIVKRKTPKKREWEEKGGRERAARTRKCCCVREHAGKRYRMHRCPAARVTGTGCNRTPITYVRTATGEIGKEEEKGRSEDKSERTRGDAKCG